MSSPIQFRFQLQRPSFCLDVDLSLPGQGVTALFGRSGSGKTTCLRAMAGLEPAAKGFFSLGSEVWQDDTKGIFLPTHQRSLGYVFQEASLFPHLSVQQNMLFGQKRIRSGSAAISMTEVSELLGIEHLMTRQPGDLSGGERQRVAIARALLSAPKILLMDEPLAALDIQRKQEILPYLERLQQGLSIPIVYVSHAPDEVARLADHLVLLDQGRVIGNGPINQVLGRLDLPSAFADDVGVVLNTVIVSHEPDALSCLALGVKNGFGEPSQIVKSDVNARASEGPVIFVGLRTEPIGTPMRCRIHARDVSLALTRPSDSSILNLIEATVIETGMATTPGHALVKLETITGAILLARLTERSCKNLVLAPGKQVWAQIKAVALLD